MSALTNRPGCVEGRGLVCRVEPESEAGWLMADGAAGAGCHHCRASRTAPVAWPLLVLATVR